MATRERTTTKSQKLHAWSIGDHAGGSVTKVFILAVQSQKKQCYADLFLYLETDYYKVELSSKRRICVL